MTGSCVRTWKFLKLSVPAGKSVCIKQIYNGTAPDAAAFGLIIFAGHIETFETKVNSSGEAIEIIATDASATLKRVAIYGQRVVNADDSSLFLPGLETVFLFWFLYPYKKT